MTIFQVPPLRSFAPMRYRVCYKLATEPGGSSTPNFIRGQTVGGVGLVRVSRDACVIATAADIAAAPCVPSDADTRHCALSAVSDTCILTECVRGRSSNGGSSSVRCDPATGALECPHTPAWPALECHPRTGGTSVPATAVASSPPMGLYATSLDYSAASGTVSAVTVGFTSSFTLTVGDEIHVTLAGFTGPSRTDVASALSGSGAAHFDQCSWAHASRTLRLTVGDAASIGIVACYHNRELVPCDTVVAGDAVSVVVGTEAGLQLPETAIVQNQAALTIEARAGAELPR